MHGQKPHAFLGKNPKTPTPQEAALCLARRRRSAEARAASGGTRGEKECPICLKTLESTGGLVKTACPGGHIFHRSCLYRCFGDGCTADCPMCRQPIANGDETPLPRPDETPPKRRRISGFNNREVAGMAGGWSRACRGAFGHCACEAAQASAWRALAWP